MWKNEPMSPSGTSLLDVDEDWPFNDQSVDVSNNAAEVVMYDDNPSRAQVAKKLLEQLDEWIKEGKYFIFVTFVTSYYPFKISYKHINQ